MTKTQRKIKTLEKKLKRLHRKEDAYDKLAKRVHNEAARLYGRITKLKQRL